ncbi:hypothetical protein ID866_3219 [Astraeus odoratus]|nr:hypothetical protein ID866_3219 [Astraeus odoratus]
MESPLHTAHQHAANAEDYRNDGLLIKSAEEHSKAAKAFLECEEKSSDINTKRTLHLLYNEHAKAEKELERRIAKLREEGKDPTLPQKPSPRVINRAATGPTGLSQTSYLAHSPIQHPSTSMRLMDSQNNVDESFMLLGHRSDPGDAFNNFWKIMEGMLDNLSQPVAFATAPLEQDMLLEETEEEVLVDEGGDLSESFYLIPTGPEVSVSALRRENASLKQEVEEMQKRLAAAERIVQLRKEQDQQLRDSIVLARQQAQRAMGASLVIQRSGGQPPPVDLSALNINLPTVPAPVTALNSGRDREAQHLRRIRELEEELRMVRMENDKQKIMITRFRERWEKLKESAKRKKDAKAAEAAKIGIGERIEEEPEAERELDEASRRP